MSASRAQDLRDILERMNNSSPATDILKRHIHNMENKPIIAESDPSIISAATDDRSEEEIKKADNTELAEPEDLYSLKNFVV